MKKLIALSCLFGAPAVFALATNVPAIVLVLVFFGLGDLITSAIPLLAAVLGILVIFGRSVDIEVNFITLLL